MKTGVLHITFQGTDALWLRRRALQSTGRQPQNVVERNRTKARSADCGFAEPSRRKAACSYLLLCAGFLLYIFSLIISNDMLLSSSFLTYSSSPVPATVEDHDKILDLSKFIILQLPVYIQVTL